MFVLYCFFNLIVIGIFHYPSYISAFTYLFILLIYNKFILKESARKVTYTYAKMLFICLLLYLIQYLTFPRTIGLTIGHLIDSAGTDDVFFYGQAAIDFPSNYPFRGLPGGDFSSLDGYAKVLRLFAIMFHVFYPNCPIDLLGFNVAVMSLLPFYTVKILKHYTIKKSTENFLDILICLCPFLVSNGLVLVRDGIITVLFCIFFLNYIENKWMKMIIALVGIALLRLGTFFIIFIVLGLNVFYRSLRHLRKKQIINIILFILFGVILLVCFKNYFIDYYISKMGGKSVSRQFLIESALGSATKMGINKTEYYSVLSMSPILKIPLSTIVFFVAPMFDINMVVLERHFIIRNFLFNVVYPIVFSFSLPFFVCGIVMLIRKKDKILLMVYFSTLILLAVISIQIRHKTLIMPLYYIICMVGKESKFFFRKIWLLCGGMIFLFQIIYNFI